MLLVLILAAAAMQFSPFAFESRSPTSHALRWHGSLVVSMEGPVGQQAYLGTIARPVFLGYPHGPKTAEFAPPGRTVTKFVLPIGPGTIIVHGGPSSFACSDRADTPLGSVYGGAVSSFANSVYDRDQDWLVSVTSPSTSVRRKGRYSYEITIKDRGELVVQPNAYRDYLGYFLWDKKKPLWTKPVAGWCSWMAHLQDVKEEDIVQAANFFGRSLKEYGYSVIQIDDGYQRVKQFGEDKKGTEPFSSYWTTPNEKFPHGMEWLAHTIKAAGLTPGIWVGYYLPLGLKHEEGYVRDPDGKPHKGPWVNYAVNGFDGPARDEAYIDTIRGFKRQGWDYFKIDTLRHVLYDSYRQVPSYWQQRSESMEQAYRTIMAETKKAAGSSYVLACWGVIPELAGLPDGARIGEDVGPDFDSMRRTAKYIAQFQYLNNVVWRNDPDYMCLRVPVDQARAWASMTFLAGGHIMVSDPIAAYDADRIDILRRVGPPLVCKPLNVVTHEPDPEFMSMDLRKGGESWLVLGRFAWKDLPPTTFRLRPEGDGGKILAFDFWDEKFLGSSTEIPFRALNKGECQVLCLRPELGRPQVLGTNRHLAQGIVELDGVKWSGSTLSGRFNRAGGRRWSLYLHVPAGWLPDRVLPMTAEVSMRPEVMKLTLPEGKDPLDWSVSFRKVR